MKYRHRTKSAAVDDAGKDGVSQIVEALATALA